MQPDAAVARRHARLYLFAQERGGRHAAAQQRVGQPALPAPRQHQARDGAGQAVKHLRRNVLRRHDARPYVRQGTGFRAGQVAIQPPQRRGIARRGLPVRGQPLQRGPGGKSQPQRHAHAVHQLARVQVPRTAQARYALRILAQHLRRSAGQMQRKAWGVRRKAGAHARGTQMALLVRRRVKRRPQRGGQRPAKAFSHPENRHIRIRSGAGTNAGADRFHSASRRAFGQKLLHQGGQAADMLKDALGLHQPPCAGPDRQQPPFLQKKTVPCAASRGAEGCRGGITACVQAETNAHSGLSPERNRFPSTPLMNGPASSVLKRCESSTASLTATASGISSR